MFLVEGKPVITFWGFVNLNENPRDDVLDCLRLADIPPVVTVAEPEPEEEITAQITFVEADAPLLTPVVELPKPAEPEPQPRSLLTNLKSRRRSHRRNPHAACRCGACPLPR